ncbi:MAG: type II secretion system protein GspE [Planctomycetota bacterium]|nr:MAG: type II secretion system protein GspE [Planctomycetota bacterium]
MATPTTPGRLGQRLLEQGLVSRAQLDVALSEQRRAHRPLGEILTGLGFVDDEAITRIVAEDLGFEFLRAEDVRPDPLVLSGLDPDFVRETRSFPYALDGGELCVLMVEPDDPRRVAEVRRRFPYPLRVAVTTDAQIQKLLHDHLQKQASRVAEIIAELGTRAGQGEFPVERVTHALLVDAVHRNATDVHVEPEERVTRVRYRIDGILHSAENLPVEHTAAVISRLKILSNLDIAERRRPQDGRLRLSVDGRDVDMRVSTMPTAYGENLVARVLDRSGATLHLAGLGLSDPLQKVLQRVGTRSHGVFLVTGPTGSGKTSTLYALLGTLDAMGQKVATIEDPIECSVPLVRQSQVDPSIGYDFHAGLRSLLRQDPDVILVGEIRDHETADMCIKAAMTGHLVLSTLHTNSALGAIPRLVDIGVEPFLVGDALIGVMAQRLVRRICDGCRTAYVPTARDLAWLGAPHDPPHDPPAERLERGAGCARCGGSGFQGRTAMCEVFLPDAGLLDLLRERCDTGALQAYARQRGFRTMLDDGRRLVRERVTTIDEVLRVHSAHHLSEDERAGV